MGYDFHITRASRWTESDRHPITVDEWLTVVDGDPELQIDPDNGPPFALWSGPCCDEGGGWFDWSDGEIFTKHPDRAILGKMLELAARLGATVQGDDGEAYTDPSQLLDASSPEMISHRRWERLMAVAGPILMVISVGLLIFIIIKSSFQ